MGRPALVNARMGVMIVEKYSQDWNLSQIADEFQVSRKTISRYLKKCRIPIRSAKEVTSININHGAFDDVENNPEAAYWVGFLMADGCIKGNYVITGVSILDFVHLEKFRSFLGSEHPLRVSASTIRNGYKSKPFVSLTFSSKFIVNRLANYGVVPRKSHTASVRFLENNRDFWRGVIDGDGHISLQKRNGGKHKPRPIIQLTGSKQICHQFVSFAKTITDSRSEPYQTKNSWGVAYNTRHAVSLIRHLYSQANVYLHRKHAAASKILSFDAVNQTKSYQFR